MVQVCVWNKQLFDNYILGRIQEFYWDGGGGGTKDYVHARTSQLHKREAQSPLRPWSRACLRALEALGFFMLSRAIWTLFKSILIQNGIKQKHSRTPAAPPSGSATEILRTGDTTVKKKKKMNEINLIFQTYFKNQIFLLNKF